LGQVEQADAADFAQRDLVPVGQGGFGHRLAVDQRAAAAVEVAELDVASL
jgi:hypothetical protein